MKISILCVDDDPNILEGYRRLFSRRYDVYLALGPLQGLDKLDLGPQYAVVLSDKHMPDMDGVEFLRRVSQRFPSSVRVMLTGDADNQTAIDAVNNGNIQRFLLKPCPSKTLEQVVDESVALWRQQNQSLALCQVRRVAQAQLCQSLALALPEEAALGERALARARQLASRRDMDLPEAAEVALRLCELGALGASPAATTLEKATRGAAVLGGMPGWDQAPDLLLQCQGVKVPGLLGSLLKLALDIERVVGYGLSLPEALTAVRPAHLDSPWMTIQEAEVPGLCLASAA